MSKEPEFVYEKECWYVSALINTNYVACIDNICEIEALIKEKVANLTDKDLKKIDYNPEYVKKVKDLGKSMFLECKWVPFIEFFPYHNENKDLFFNSLGYFRFEVEYYKDAPEKKASIESLLIQQIPTIVLDLLRAYGEKAKNQYLFMDPESPIYTFVVSTGIQPENIQWSQENIEEYKKVIGNWTEIYSGQWSDYSESLYNSRIKNNLSNRLSELHFIRRNSGFIFMVEENYKMFFNRYMRPYVLEPTARIRAILFALMALNESIDILFVRMHHQKFDLDAMEEKLRSLKYLRGMIQTQMSVIYNELDYNRRQHYTRVLTHLMKEFHLEKIIERLSNKFDVFYDSMQVHYQKRMEDKQSNVARGMTVLNLLFGFGILADLGQVLAIALSNDPATIGFNWGVFIGINVLLLIIAIYILRIRLKIKGTKSQKTVDAVIVDENGNIVMVERKLPPFKGQFAFPGGFLDEGESYKEAVLREVKEETDLDVEIVKKIGVFNKPGRDPRGAVETTAFLCTVKGDIRKAKGGDDAALAKIKSIVSLKDRYVAFDHEDILRAAMKLIADQKTRGLNSVLDSEKLLESAKEFLK